MSPNTQVLFLKAAAYFLAGAAFFTLTLMGMLPVSQFVSLVSTLVFILTGAHLASSGVATPPFLTAPQERKEP